MYGSISLVKDRLNILSTDTSHDSALTIVLSEASRYIDEKLRPFVKYAQNCTLSSDNYIDCEPEDLYRIVYDDNIKIGELLDYNNDSYVWKIRCTGTVAPNSSMSIENGIGTGIATGSGNAIVQQIEPHLVFNSLPLGTIPSIIQDIAYDYAAGLYLQRNLPDEYSTKWFVSSTQKLGDFINSNFKQGKFKI